MNNPSDRVTMERVQFSHRLEWMALRLGTTWIQRGDMAAAHRRAWGFASLGRRVLRKNWAWTRTNLRLVYGPEPDQDLLDRLARQAFGNIFCSYLESLRCAEMVYRDEGFEYVRQAFDLGRGLIFCSVHLGSWETGLHRVAHNGIPLAVVYRPASNPLSEREFLRARSTYGIEWIPRKNPRRTVRVLQEKRALGLMVDINTLEGAITAPFLGVPAQCPEGPARLALRFQVPVVPILSIREGVGRASLLALPPIEPQAGTPTPERAAALTRTIHEAVTPWIHRHAEQYNWLHGRWRARPDGAQWRVDTPLERMWAERVEPFLPLDPDLCARLRE